MKWLKPTLVVLGAVIFSTVAINATDLLRGGEASVSRFMDGGAGPCGPGATVHHFGSHSICVDIYESSPGEGCPIQDPQNELDTARNLNELSCTADSKSEVIPWRFVSQSQAAPLCARSGKRLPNNDEWYSVALGIKENEGCVVDPKNQSALTTGNNSCVTNNGVYDVIGNVWEWVDEEVSDGVYNNRPLPESGYVAEVDTNGIATRVSDQSEMEFGHDYFSMNENQIRGMVRGGHYASGEDAGLFAVNASVPLSFKAAGIGFRCVSDL